MHAMFKKQPCNLMHEAYAHRPTALHKQEVKDQREKSSNLQAEIT